MESGGQRAGDINARTMGVTAAQESEAGKDAQDRERQGERMSEENDNSTRETKRIREEDDEHMGDNRTQREKAAEHKCRRTVMVQTACNNPTCTTTTTTTTTVYLGH